MKTHEVPAATADPQDRVDLDGGCVLLPVRHHSPACAWHVAKVVRALTPDVVLVEGPSDADDRIEALLDEKTVPPVAIFGFVRGDEAQPGGSCFYPFCSHSPEYAALAAGRDVGAELAFLDAPTWLAVQLRGRGTPKTNAYADAHLAHHAYLKELCRATRTRDFDELWDRLFESSGPQRTSEDFFTQVATYCRIARLHSDPKQLEAEGNNVRESFMAARIRDKLDAGRRVVAVVGGFHRAGIAELLAFERRKRIPSPKPPRAANRGVYLTVYGQVQLDRWSGYQAGMSAPEFRRRIWEGIPTGEYGSAERLLQEAHRAVRSAGETLSTADLVAAGSMLRGLMQLRGHVQPTLADVRDAVRSSWSKEALDASGDRVLDMVDRFLVGTRVGRTPPSAGRPPIVEDFYRRLRDSKIARSESDLAAMGTRRLSLDIYRRRPHRVRSALLHQLNAIGCDFARLESGPDFVQGVHLKRVREIWSVRWRPEIEAALVEASLHGATVAEAAANRLTERVRAAGPRTSAAAAVAHLTAALVMDLPELAPEFVASVRRAVESEGNFVSSARAYAGLVHLIKYRAVLQARRFPSAGALVGEAYRRATWLIDSLPGAPADLADQPADDAARGLLLLRHAAFASDLAGVDPELFVQALERVRPRLGAHPVLQGVVAGILRQLGRLTDADVRRAVDAAVDNTVAGPDAPLGAFLQGLFAARPHALVEEFGLFDAVHRCLADMDGDRFLRALPSLRLAFTRLTPREVRRMVRIVDERTKPAGAAPRPPLDDDDKALAQLVDRNVEAVLKRWGWDDPVS